MFYLTPPRHISTLPNPVLGAFPIYVRLGAASGNSSGTARCRSSATTGLMQRSKWETLFDHLVGAGEERGRDGETKRLCSPEIDD